MRRDDVHVRRDDVARPVRCYSRFECQVGRGKIGIGRAM